MRQKSGPRKKPALHDAEVENRSAVDLIGKQKLSVIAKVLGSGTHNQKMTVAAMQMALMKACAQRSYRVAMRRQGPVRLEDLVDDRDEPVELRTHRRLGSPVSWRHGVLQDFPDRLAVDAERPRRFALAHPFDMARPAHPTVKFHRIHLPAFSSLPQAQGADFYSATVRKPDRFRCPICLRDSQPFLR